MTELMRDRLLEAVLDALDDNGHNGIQCWNIPPLDVTADAILARVLAVLADPDGPKSHAMRTAVETVLNNEGGQPGSSLHSWRCEYPDHYGPCNCVAEIASECAAAALTALVAHLGEAS